MGFVVGLLVVLAVILYLRQISRSRQQMEQLHYPSADDLRRADENQRPPVDGSAGFV